MEEGRLKRLFWIDALCINQADLAERNAQVAAMGRIYAFGRQTIVWLDQHSRPGVDDAAFEVSQLFTSYAKDIIDDETLADGAGDDVQTLMRLACRWQ